MGRYSASTALTGIADSVNHGVTGLGGVGHCGGELYGDVGDSVVAAAVAQVGVGDGGNVDRLNVESVLRQRPVYPSIDVAVGDEPADVLRRRHRLLRVLHGPDLGVLRAPRRAQAELRTAVRARRPRQHT